MSESNSLSVGSLWIAIEVRNKAGDLLRHRKPRRLRGPYLGKREDKGSVSRYVFPVDKYVVKGDLVLDIDNKTGTINGSSKNLIVNRKLAKRKYVVIGYDLKANLSNANRRRKYTGE